MQKGFWKMSFPEVIYSILIFLLHLNRYNLNLDKIYPDFIKHIWLQKNLVTKKTPLYRILFLTFSGEESAMVTQKYFKVPLILLAFWIAFEKLKIACISTVCALLCRCGWATIFIRVLVKFYQSLVLGNIKHARESITLQINR